MVEVNASLGKGGGLRKWLHDDWTHMLVFYGVIVVTLSLLVQIIATVMIGRL